MVYVCTICVVLFSFVKLNEAVLGPMPPQLLEKVLKQVHKLLSNVSTKIATEKKLLVELENESKLNTKVKETGKDNAGVWAGQHLEIIDPIRRPVNNQNPANKATLLKTVPEAVDFEPDPFDTIVFEQEADETTTQTTVKPTIPIESPEKKSIMYHMKKNNVGYAYGAAIGLMDILLTKHEEMLKRLINALAQTFSLMVSKNELKCLGYAVTEHMNYAISVLRFASTLAVQGRGITGRTAVFMTNRGSNTDKQVNHYGTPTGIAEKVSYALKNKIGGAYPNVYQLLMKYDGFFTAQEGNNLLDSVIKLYRNRDVSADRALNLTRDFLNALIAPTVRLCETNEIKKFMAEVDNEYNINIINGRSIPANYVNLAKTNVLKSPIEAPKSIYDKDYVMGFVEVVHAFIVKYETLFKEFAKEQNYVEHHDKASVKSNRIKKSE